MIDKRRLSRIEEEFKRRFSSILLNKIRDPNIGFVTVTRIKISSDLKYAKIYLSFMGNSKEKEEGFKALLRAKSFIKKELSAGIKLKTLPELCFIKDESLDHVFKIETILKKISKNNS